MQERPEGSKISCCKEASLLTSFVHSFIPSSTTVIEFLPVWALLGTGDTETIPSQCLPLGAPGHVPSSFSKCVSWTSNVRIT